MTTLWSTFKRGLLLLFLFVGLIIFVAKNCYEFYLLAPKIPNSPATNILIYAILIMVSAWLLGYLGHKITLIVNVFFRKLGHEAFWAEQSGEILHPLITTGEIVHGDIAYCVCYPASILWVLLMPAKFIKKSSPYLIITPKNALAALFSSAQYYKDQNSPASKN